MLSTESLLNALLHNNVMAWWINRQYIHYEHGIIPL